jgi:hypothetical protein
MSKIRLYGSTSGYVELAAPAVADDGTLTLPTAADGFGPAGIGSNVVQAVKTDTFTTTSDTYTTVTGLSTSITPTSNTSKVLVIAQISVGLSNADAMGHFKVTRGGTEIYVGDASSSRVQNVFGGYNYVNNQGLLVSQSIVYLDSPATTSATNYRVEARRGNAAGTARVNLPQDGTNNANFGRGVSSITVIEVAA